MDLYKQGMKGPTRPAPSIPGQLPNVTRYSPVTNWNDDPFGADVFEPTPQYMQKKKPPPRPPPPKVNMKPPDVPLKPSHFIRKPTVLSSILSRRNKSTNQNQIPNMMPNTNPLISEINNDLDTHKMFPKCEPKNVQTGTLIDLASPPSSPTFTTRSSSDGLSVDSFGSDATTSTNHHNLQGGGNASQAESGFEDDFDLFLHSRKAIPKDDTLDDFTAVDPFSPQAVKPAVSKKPTLNRDLFELSSSQPVAPLLKGPTIIRAKPARPKPPDNSALLKNTFGSSFPITPMNINTTTPIQKISNGFTDPSDWKPTRWEDDRSPERESPEREWSPPMPSVPPPPPPAEAEIQEWPAEPPATVVPVAANLSNYESEEPNAIALFDYSTDHPDDLNFSAGAKITLIRRVDSDWLCGRLRNGVEGLFPANYVEIKVPLPNETIPKKMLGMATAVYDFEPAQPGDLPFATGDQITILYKINDEWYFGECKGLKGQFPVNYVQMS